MRAQHTFPGLRLFLVGLGLLAANARAELSPSLVDLLQRTGDSQATNVLVFLKEQASIEALDFALTREHATRAERHRRVIQELKAATLSQRRLLDALEQAQADGGVESYTSYWIANVVAVRARGPWIRALAGRGDVAWIEPSFTAAPIDGDELAPSPRSSRAATGGSTPTGLRAIGATSVWHTFGLNGAGRVIGTLDTGADATHPALSASWRGNHGHPWQECWLDRVGTGAHVPEDPQGHGTHVMGILCGLDPATQDTIGVAWGAEWISCNAVRHGVGGAFDNDVLAAYQWFADPDGDAQTIDDVPDVVENSWRVNEEIGYGYTDCDPRWWTAMDNLEAAGVCLVFAAGNEGSDASTIGSPADRATTTLNAFSIGSVNATSLVFPYPIHFSSSRGPSGCAAPAGNKIKPELVAPGVEIYSSDVDHSYTLGTGTSFAAPHVAGAIVLLRQADPDIEVNTMKQMLLTKARDEGTTGDDNSYGRGFLDVYAAVSTVIAGLATLDGTVRNGSWGSIPLEGAQVSLAGTSVRLLTDAAGFYSGRAEPGTYTATYSLSGFASQNQSITLQAGVTTHRNVSLLDNAAPSFAAIAGDGASTNTTGPYLMSAVIRDPSTVASAKLYSRIDGGSWTQQSMSRSGDLWSASVGGRPSGSRIDFYFEATDGPGHVGRHPSSAPAQFLTRYVTESVLTQDFEASVADWTVGGAGDAAPRGIWICDDPVGTWEDERPIQPEADHTAPPSTRCFVTGNALPGEGLGVNDVDNGCTSLLSPIFSLVGSDLAFLRYSRWFGEGQYFPDDSLEVDLSSDAGASWHALERIADGDTTWTAVLLQAPGTIAMTGQMRLRVRACDLGIQGIEEAAFDDFAVESWSSLGAASGVAEQGEPAVRFNRVPSPAAGQVGIELDARSAAIASLIVYDVSGREVRSLLAGPLAVGRHTAIWNGRDDAGRSVAPGMYFLRLRAGDGQATSRLIWIK